jgi:hypothetical protein
MHHRFRGTLSIGGMQLRDVCGELEEERRQTHSQEWRLSGRVSLKRSQLDFFQAGRTCRLELDDGRAGQVVLEHLAPGLDALVARFRPRQPR